MVFYLVRNELAVAVLTFLTIFLNKVTRDKKLD